jgi:glycosyltransferase involved in cell wall biosynthesis
MLPSSLRVLHVTTTGRIGGAERIIADLVRVADADGSYRPAICVLRDPAGLRRELADTRVRVGSLDVTSPLTALRGFVALIRLMRTQRFDIVHTHLIHASVFGLLAAVVAGVPLRVMTRHFERYLWMFAGRRERAMQLMADRLADAIFAVSRAAATTMIERERVRPDRIIVAPNGIDIDRVAALAAMDGRGGELGPWERPTIGTVGTLTARKGQRFLIEAVAQLPSPLVADLVIVGDGELRSELEHVARRSGVAGQVHFTGYIQNVYPVVSRFDIYAQPSVEEGFGIAVLEAMALGKAVVATRVGGLPEIVEDGVTGLLVDAADAGALAAAIARLAHDPEMRERLGAAARIEVSRRFGVRVCAQRYADAYRELLSRREGRRR